MMERRYLELTAQGTMIGTTIPLRLVPPEGVLRCGEVLDFELEMEPPQGTGLPLVLRASAERGLTLQGGAIEVPAQGTNRTFITLKLVVTGTPGPTTIETVIKESGFHATLGLSSADIDILPAVIRVVPAAGMTVLDPAKGGSIELVLTRNGTDRTKCQLEFELVDHKGGRVRSKADTPRKLSFKDEIRFVQELVPDATLQGGTYSLEVTVIHEGIKDRTTLKDVISVDTGQGALSDERPGTSPARFSVKRFEAHPASILPGETATITLECIVPEGASGPLVPTIRVGPIAPVTVEMPPLDRSGISRALFVPGPDMPGGDIPSELILSDGERTLLREVHHGFLNIRTSSEMELLIRTALDMVVQGKGPLSTLLLPDERPVLKENTGELTVWTLSSGRHILALGGRVLGGKDDTGTDRSGAKGLFVLHCLRKALLESGTVKGLKDNLPKERWLIRVLAAGNREGQGKGPSSGWTGTALDLYKGLTSRKGKISGTDASAERLLSTLDSLFERSDDGPETDLSSLAMQTMLESALSDLKRSRERPSRKGTLEALDALAGTAERSVKLLASSNDASELRKASVDLLGSFCLECLIRLESMSSWDDPAVNAWDDLRTERQRMIKHEIGRLLDLPVRLVAIERASLGRFDACMRNMERRWSLSSMKGLRELPASLLISGTGGSDWERRLVVPLLPGAQPVDVRAFLRLPGRAWQLLSPRSERVGELLDLGTVHADSGSPFHLEIKVRVPRSPPPKVTGLLYIAPENIALEEEP